MTGFCARCGESEHLDVHHRKLRSQGGDDSRENLVGLCRDCHNWVHANPAAAYADGWLVHSWDDPAKVGIKTTWAGLQQTVDGAEVPHEEVVGEKHEHGDVQPGQKCPTCKRRVNHPARKSSPKSEIESLRMPAGDKEVWQETLETVAEHVGVKVDEKYWKHKVILLALAYLLQTDAKALKQELQGRGG